MIQKTLSCRTTDEGDILDLTGKVREIVTESEAQTGI